MVKRPIPRPDYSRAGAAREMPRLGPDPAPDRSRRPAPDYSRAGANREVVDVARASAVAIDVAGVIAYIDAEIADMTTYTDDAIAALGDSVALPDGTAITPDSTGKMNTHANTQAAGTLTVNAPTGSPVNGQSLTLRIACTNAQTLSWNAAFRGSTDLPLPTATTGAGDIDYFGFAWNATDSKWDILAVNKGF